VAAGAMEWFGSDRVAQEVELADADKDRRISPKDFDNWFESALKRKQQSPSAASAGPSVTRTLPFSALALIALEAGLPFVGFGFLDNATMIIAGDAIDSTVGFYLNCTVMASAAMGNVVSGMLGMQVHGLVEKAVHALKLNTPVLTDEERHSRPVFLAGHIGGTLGIMIGLTLGMLPLLFLREENEKLDMVIFRKWDKDGNGALQETELRAGLAEVGFHIDEKTAREIVAKYSKNGRMDAAQFHLLCSDLRKDRR